MLIGISGNVCAGKSEVAKYLKFQGFQRLYIHGTTPLTDYVPSASGSELQSESSEPNTPNYEAEYGDRKFGSAGELVDYVTKRWRKHFVVDIQDLSTLEVLAKRPFFLHIAVDAPLMIRYERYKIRFRSKVPSLEEFVKMNDDFMYSEKEMAVVTSQAQVTVVNQMESIEQLYIRLSSLNLLSQERLRPSWDAYFMRLAGLAALRSNCMKRRVGCVLVRDKSVIATGYNGTPRGLSNCNEGGCKRCNEANGSGAGLATCLCLHAEENALLEAGRDRIGSRSILYCNTCPCLTCSIKIVQSGIKEVVYSLSYSMDDASAKVLQGGGIILRQYSPPSQGVVV